MTTFMAGPQIDGRELESPGNESFVADATLVYNLGEVETIRVVAVQSGLTQ